jgi:hypothetical protein
MRISVEREHATGAGIVEDGVGIRGSNRATEHLVPSPISAEQISLRNVISSGVVNRSARRDQREGGNGD